MRILHVCHWNLASPDAETIRKLALTRELARRGHEVVLIAPDLGRAKERMPRGARVVYAPTVGGRFAAHLYALGLFPLLVLAAIGFRPDAVYLTDYTASAPVALLLRLLGMPFALEVNGIPLQDARLQGIGNPLWLALIDLFSRTTYRLAARFAVVSPEIAENVRASVGGARAVDRRSIDVVPNGVDLDAWRPSPKRDARARLGLPLDRPVVGFLGGFWPWQGLDRLVRAAPLVLEKVPDALFLVAGFGPEEEKLRALVRDEGLDAAFRFPGKVPLEQGPLWVNAFDVGVHLVRPGKACSPVKLLCYAACARRCVATRGVDGFEGIEEQGLGRRVDYDDLASIGEGIVQELLRARPDPGLGPRAPAAERIGWDGIAARTEELLHALSAAPGASR